MAERPATQVPRPAHRRRGRAGHHHPRGRLRLPGDRRAHRHARRRGLLLRRRPQEQLGWDDALDVWGVHGVGGFVGIVLLGLFADKAWNPNMVTNGLLAGGGFSFFGKQLAAVAISSVWAFVFTYGMLWIINRITPVKVGEGVEEQGLDMGLHGEQAYTGTL